MKTSNKLILVGVLLLVVSLVAFDFMIRAEYIAGTYKNPYKDFADLKFKDFDRVDILSSSTSNVKIIQGPYKVMIDAYASDYTVIRQQGRRLLITTTYKGSYLYNPQPFLVILSCPKLAEVNASATYLKNKNIPVTDTLVREAWNMRQVLIEGFNEDSLAVRQNYGSTVIFSKNHIRSVNVIAGISDKSGSKLVVLNNNQFQHASIDIRNRSRLFINGNNIQNLKYHLADSAQMTVSGAAQSILNNSNPTHK